MATKVRKSVLSGSVAERKRVSSGLPAEVVSILEEDNKRQAEIHAKFNPITGEGSIGDRVKLDVKLKKDGIGFARNKRNHE